MNHHEFHSFKSDKEIRDKNFVQPRNSEYVFVRDGSFSIVKFNICYYGVSHVLYLVAAWMCLHPSNWSTTNAYTLMIAGVFYEWANLSSCAGSHRLWSHRSYKASLPLQIFLMIGQTIAGQNPIHTWVRDHRVHHKFSDTDADPHNSHRGLFYSHIGWLLRKKHPQVIIEWRKLTSDDLMDDPVIRFQKEHYRVLYFVFGFLIPTLLPCLLVGESLFRSFMIAYHLRYLNTLHAFWFINSAAHCFGSAPYDHRIQPRESMWTTYATRGEGFHNFHHAFPTDYRTSEHGNYFNSSAFFIKIMAMIGLASNLKTVSKEMIESRKQKSEAAKMMKQG